jgi:hypothetical protein
MINPRNNKKKKVSTQVAAHTTNQKKINGTNDRLYINYRVERAESAALGGILSQNDPSPLRVLHRLSVYGTRYRVGFRQNIFNKKSAVMCLGGDEIPAGKWDLGTNYLGYLGWRCGRCRW